MAIIASAEQPFLARAVELPRADSAASRARDFLRGHFGDRMTRTALADAQLVLSELVTNALLHGEGRIVLDLRLQGDALRIEVVDQGDGNVPAIREQPRGEVGGWGLRIVESLAVRWGAFEGTTHVWAELPAR